jgi:nucleotide-binding universal stress UspA family protein
MNTTEPETQEQSRAVEQSKEKVHEIVHEAEVTFTPKRIIVIPVDESDQSKYTIEYAIKTILDKETDQVVLLHTRPPAVNEYNVDIGYPYLIPAHDIQLAENNLRNHSHNLLKQLAKTFQSNQIHVRAISLRGDPRQELEHKINQMKPDFVMMGSRGLNMVSRVLLGSVSEHMIHHLQVPVMIVPAPSKE